MLPLREIDLLGVYVSPFALCLPLAFLATWAILTCLRRVPAAAGPAHNAVLELGLFVMLLSLLVLSLGRV